ncbi:MAG: substrate-binding domain-containing protein [Alphaproteobacteria bacterium]|nr:substrate-binding domain-containing protein [Alphaproteobacteria bacterium]
MHPVLKFGVMFGVTLLLALPLPNFTRSDENVLVATTTSTENSGLLHYLAPKITAALGFSPRFIITGSGKALRLGMNRDVDLVWVHDEAGENTFMTAGHGLRREKIMYNRFVLGGPVADPASVRTASGILEALQRIQDTQSLFVSRGDDSGTHRRERALWRVLNAEHPVLAGAPLDWYRELGSGMGATLNTAMAMRAYTLVDEATWLRRNDQTHFAALFTGDVLLRNPYSLIVVAETGRKAATDKAQRLSDWLISPIGQNTISAYRIDGQQGFFALGKH